MRKAVKNIIFTLLLLTLGVSTALLTYLHFFAADDADISGEWTAQLDMTEQAAVAAFSWLQDIEAAAVSLEQVESCMQGVTIQVNMVLERTARSEGTFRCNIVPESYEACKQAAYEAFAAAFRGMLAERLHMAGYTGAVDEEAVEALVTETFGMSTVSYLMTCGPALLPSLEALQAAYDGSGTYKTAEGILTRQFDAGTAVNVRTERFIRQDTSLILIEETDADAPGFSAEDYPVLYTLKQMPAQ